MADPFDLLKTHPRVDEVAVWFRGDRVFQVNVRRSKAIPGKYEYGWTRPGTTQYNPAKDGFDTPEAALTDAMLNL